MKTKSFQPCIDLLEDRATPAVGFSLNQGTLAINCDNGNDQVTVRLNTKATVQTGDDRVEVTWAQPSKPTRFASYARASVQRIVFQGFGGNDTFLNNVNLPATAYGGDGDDYLVGGAQADILRGGNGNDHLLGGASNDALYGDDGNDRLVGGADHDRLYGGDGIDHLWGQAGNDLLFGGALSDYLLGGAGNDAYGEGGKDTLHGDDNGAIGMDILDGGYDSMADLIYGGLGRDTFRIHKYVYGLVQPEITPDFHWVHLDSRVVVVHTTLP